MKTSEANPNRATKAGSPSMMPIEWMVNWRLPSGKALAEFALQAGFLAPLMLSGPVPKRKAARAAAAGSAAAAVARRAGQARGSR